MANVSHASLSGSQLHEPKGIATAALGNVYVADGLGSGSWANVGTSSFTGAIADFPTPVAPDGWLELDGSVISTTTYSALYAVMTIQQTGSRTNASPIITSLTSTANMKAGYFVFGTGISGGTTILTVDSPTQITLSAGAGSSGTATVIISPWLLNTGTIKLPDLVTVGRFRRSRSSTTAIGQLQADQNVAHTHGVSGTSGTQSANHFHNVSGLTGTENQQHQHNVNASVQSGTTSDNTAGSVAGTVNTTILSGNETAQHTHSINIDTSIDNATHTHNINLTSASSGSTEARPLSIVLMTCVKT